MLDEIEKMPEASEIAEGVEILERNSEIDTEVVDSKFETQEIAVGLELDRRRHISQEISSESAFDYSKAYFDEDGRYVPRQITGIYRDALESGAAVEVAEYLKAWSHQESVFSCAAACASMEIKARGGGVSENELCRVGESGGWYNPKNGTYIAEIGKFAESQGMSTSRHARELTLSDLDELKQTGAGLIVCVDSEILERPNLDKPCATNHVVEVIGFDNSNSAKPLVLVNDPGDMNGRGAAYELSHFERAAGANFPGGVLKNVTAIYGRE